MKLIQRTRYIDEIKPFINTPIIKILTGMRRVGKSTLLMQIKDSLLTNVDKDHKIYMNFESLDYQDINDSQSFKEALLPILPKDNKRIYLFFDEIQLVDGWEKVINGLRLNELIDIYIAGSNSSVISSELSTLLAGRYVEFEIQPFVFSEFVDQYESTGLNKEDLFKQYISIGGMPVLKYFNLDYTSSYHTLQDIYNTVVVKDVLTHYSIRDVQLFNKIMSYVIENVGHTFSALQISKYLKSENRKISVDTVLNYLDYMCKAYVIKRVPRFDTVGKKILKTEEKYYLTDHGFRSALGYSNEKDIERILENIVYVELVSRGYKVYIGKVDKYEVDFIAQKENTKEYYQITYVMESETTRQREFGVFNNIQDNYPKYVLSMDHLDFSQDGITHLNIIDFLCNTNK